MRRSGSLSAAVHVLRQTVCDVWAAQAMEWAAALACYGVLSLFPLLLAGAAVVSYVVAPAVVTARLSAVVEAVLPAGVVDVDPIVSAAIAARGQVGLLVLSSGSRRPTFWARWSRRSIASRMSMLDTRRSAPGAGRAGRSRGAIGLLFLVALVTRSLLGVLWEAVWGTGASTPLAWAVGVGVHALLLMGVFFALYTVVPHGERDPRAALIGAIAATVLVLVARAIFLAVLLTWGWVLGLITLFGGSLASHVKVMVFEGRSAAEAERLHVAHKMAG